MLPLLVGESYGALIKDSFSGDDHAFFQYLIAQDPSERVIIYCDANSLLTILTKFWKTLYGSWTPESYVTMVNMYLTGYQEMYGTGHAPDFKMSAQEAIDVYAAYSAILSNDNVDQLKSDWSATAGWRISRQQRESIISAASIELQMVSCAVNPSWRYASALKAKVVRMVKKELIHEFAANYRFAILDALVDFKQLVPTTTFDVFEHTVDDLVKMHPDYAFLNDPKFFQDNLEYVYSTYDMNKIREINDLVISQRLPFEPNWSPLIKQDLTYEAILNYELSGKNTRLFMRYGEYHSITSPCVIDALLNALRAGDVSHLAAFELK
jgi:hypothetical protein